MKIGILALQGAFIEHKYSLDALGAESFEIRQKKDIEKPFDGLIIPGGESTVIGKLLHKLDLYEPIKNMIENGMPVKPDEKVIKEFLNEVYPKYKNNKRVDILLNNTDFGVGENKE